MLCAKVRLKCGGSSPSVRRTGEDEEPIGQNTKANGQLKGFHLRSWLPHKHSAFSQVRSSTFVLRSPFQTMLERLREVVIELYMAT